MSAPEGRSEATGAKAAALSARLSVILGLVAALRRARLLAPMRPDRYLRVAAAIRREGFSATSGFASAAQRCPERPGLVDELGTLTWRELDRRCDALAAALQALPGGAPHSIGIMCRNHRGFVEALVAVNRIGAEVVLLNTSFAGPALAEVVQREGVDAVIYDEEFTATVERALAESPAATRIVAWADNALQHDLTVEKMIGEHPGQRPTRCDRNGRLILLTSGTTGTPKGARQSGGGLMELKAILERIPWRAEETTVVVAPMFHAWGFSQLVLSASMACTIVTRRKFDPEATLQLIDRHRATGLCVVPVMVDRIVELPDDVRKRYSGRSLRFATASGSRMRPDVVIAFMDQFGDVIFNNYNATEAGMIATATPEDLRAAPDTAGKPAVGTEVRILDENRHELPRGEIGQIFVHNSTQFDGYTSGTTKEFHGGYMASGDIGYLDGAGRLFVVGRDDEMIVSGGENVYPIEVEKTLASHPDVAEASVLGVDDEQFGQRLVAFVVLNDRAPATSEDLRQHVRENLANYKVPREITVVDELPRNSTGKIARSELLSRIGAPTADGS
jgi:acyl-CoA synthetase (AMP-forming)/AMP-acid ligase II